jgi:hypothetical protein
VDSNPGIATKNSKSCKFPHKTEESAAGAGIVTASVTTLGHKLGMLFLLAEYYLEGEEVMNKVTVMIRAKLNGKYPYLTAVVNGRAS